MKSFTILLAVCLYSATAAFLPGEDYLPSDEEYVAPTHEEYAVPASEDYVLIPAVSVMYSVAHTCACVCACAVSYTHLDVYKRQ